ncbi:MAG: hypothetical protein LUD69_04400 [Oscillospiraceae bacterium]|nr:hypothetical protein [Oscillospiraceae bacterium]
MKLTEQQITEIDDRERKARAILKSLVFALEADAADEINTLGLVEAALDYLNENDKVFSVGL